MCAVTSHAACFQLNVYAARMCEVCNGPAKGRRKNESGLRMLSAFAFAGLTISHRKLPVLLRAMAARARKASEGNMSNGPYYLMSLD